MDAHSAREGGQRGKMKNVVNALEREIEGEVRFDRASRVFYSTDASLYQIEPLGVVLPRSRRDIIAVHQVAETFGVPLIPRGGGTGLAGQSVGRAVIMDLSKYMNSILDFDPEQRRVRVQPGVVQGRPESNY